MVKGKGIFDKAAGGARRKKQRDDFVGVHQDNQITWKVQDGALRPFVRGFREPIIWSPQPGSQVAFIGCPILEAILEGNRGGGKTDCLIMDYLQNVGKGFGEDYNGILFRRTFPELDDVIKKSNKWFKKIFPRAKYNQGTHTWKFPDGESLLFRFIDKIQDYDKYHGHNYAWIGWEELTTWASDGVYRKMFSTLRTANPDVPLKVRSTTNPSGPGHNWVKARFRLPTAKNIGPIIKTEEEPDRVAIQSRLHENKVLLHADPLYAQRIKAAAANPHQLAAWMDGDWNITSGGMFDDLWDPNIHIVPNINAEDIPDGWKINRTYDHGQSKPFSAGFWAESNGEPISIMGTEIGSVPGDLVRVWEWYGSTGAANEGLRMPSSEIAQGINERMEKWGITKRCKAGAADSSIWDDYEPGKSVRGLMLRHGLTWRKADKGPGSRKQGWEMLREYLKGAIIKPREKKGLYVCERCTDFIRTFPVLPRSNKNLDDVDTEAEDHIADECRYRVRGRYGGVKVKDF